MSRTTRVTIVAPHPDDEVFGVGGVMRELARRRWDLRIVAVTNGEAAFGDQDPAAREKLVRRRRNERDEALAHLGLDGRVEIVDLGVPDGDVARYENELADRLADEFGRLLLATWRRDGHPDHEAVGRAAATAATRCGARLLEYPVWAMERGCWPNRGTTRRVAIRHAAATQDAKRRAVQAFRSQLDPSPDGRAVVPASLVRRLDTTPEVLFG